MGRVIRPRPAAWEPQEQRICAQNALWEEQDRLSVALALEPDPGRQQILLEELDGTYKEVADHDWQADWERRGDAVPDMPFAAAAIPEHLQFVHHDLQIPASWQPIVRHGELVDTQAGLLEEEDDEVEELELELH